MCIRDRPYIYRTPLLESPRLNDFLGYRLLVKAESLQHTGSFKLRGATNAVWSLGDDVRHVVAFSSGNHAQGIARAVTTRGIQATIIMPEDTPKTKIEGPYDGAGSSVSSRPMDPEAQSGSGGAFGNTLLKLAKQLNEVRSNLLPAVAEEDQVPEGLTAEQAKICLLYTSPSPRDRG